MTTYKFIFHTSDRFLEKSQYATLLNKNAREKKHLLDNGYKIGVIIMDL